MTVEHAVGEVVNVAAKDHTQFEIVKNLVEVELVEPDNFLKVRETLTRIGVASRHENTLFQSCHILHKRKRINGGEPIHAYYIVHFKELFKLDGKPADLTTDDLARRNAIALMLEQWKLVRIVNRDSVKTPAPAPISQIKVIKHTEKDKWNLKEKYHIGFMRTRPEGATR